MCDNINTGIEIEYRGTMMSCYFCGTSGVMISLYIDRETTIQQAIDMLKEEINMLWDHVEYTAKYHGFDAMDVVDKMIDSKINEMIEYCKDKLDDPLNSGLEFSFAEMSELEYEMEETPVAIFTIEFTKD